MADRYWVGGSGNTSNTAHWSTTSGGSGGASVPTASDNAIFDANSHTTAYTVTQNVAGFQVLNMTWAAAGDGSKPTWAGSTGMTILGNLTKVAGMGWTFSGNCSFGATTTGKTITSAGVAYAGTINFNGSGGGWTLQDALNSGTQTINHTAGTLATAGQTVTCGTLVSSGATTRALDITGSTINLGNTTGTPWNISGSNLTLTTTGSTIKYTGNVTTSVTFAGAGFGYNNLHWSSTTATGRLDVTGANSFADFLVDHTTARSIRFPAGVTTTFTGSPGFNVTGVSGAVITIDSSSAGTAATLSKAGGDIRADYLSLKDSAATGGASWRAGPHSTNVSGNSGWVFGNIDNAVSALLAIAAQETGTPAKNAKPSVAMLCAAVESGIVVKAGTVAASVAVAAAESGNAARSTSGASTLGAASADAAGIVTAANPFESLLALAQQSGIVVSAGLPLSALFAIAAALRGISSTLEMAVLLTGKAESPVYLRGRAESPVSIIGRARSPITIEGEP